MLSSGISLGMYPEAILWRALSFRPPIYLCGLFDVDCFLDISGNSRSLGVARTKALII